MVVDVDVKNNKWWQQFFPTVDGLKYCIIIQNIENYDNHITGCVHEGNELNKVASFENPFLKK